MINKTTLDNGVRLVTEKLPHAFSVTVGLWLGVGSRDESDDFAGVSHFIEHMAFKGTARRGPLDIAREIDRLGGQANAFTSKENTCYHARALAPHLGDISDLLLDLLLSPAFDPVELERERQVILQEISAVEDTPDELVHILFGDHIWPQHPLGRSVLGSAESVSAMGRQGIMDYLDRHYRPDQLVVAAVGDLEHQQVVEMMAGSLAGLTPLPDPAPRRPPQPGPGLHVHHRELEQAHLVLGAPGPSAAAQERIPCAVLNLILGGNMSSRLFQEVRERRGLAYSVYSFQNLYSDSGLMGIYLGISPERAAEALAVVRGELADLAQHGPREDEVADAKDNLMGSILLAAEAPESRMSRLARNEFTFGRAIPLEEVVALVEAVSTEDVTDLAAGLLDPARFCVTALGPLDEDGLSESLAA